MILAYPGHVPSVIREREYFLLVDNTDQIMLKFMSGVPHLNNILSGI